MHCGLLQVVNFLAEKHLKTMKGHSVALYRNPHKSLGAPIFSWPCITIEKHQTVEAHEKITKVQNFKISFETKNF